MFVLQINVIRIQRRKSISASQDPVSKRKRKKKFINLVILGSCFLVSRFRFFFFYHDEFLFFKSTFKKRDKIKSNELSFERIFVLFCFFLPLALYLDQSKVEIREALAFFL